MIRAGEGDRLLIMEDDLLPVKRLVSGAGVSSSRDKDDRDSGL